MEQFKKEDRYLVIKREELDHVLNNLTTIANADTFRSIVDIAGVYRESLGKEPFDCVIAKAGTPEYGEVWRSIEEKWKDDQGKIEYQNRIDSGEVVVDYDVPF